MATVTEVTLTCDVCGDANDVKTRLFGLDGKAYEIDLCGKDGDGLSRVTAGYIVKARKVTPRPGHREGQRRHGSRRPVRGATAVGGGAGAAPGTSAAGRGRVVGSRREEAKTSRSRRSAGAVGGAEASADGSATAPKAGRLQQNAAGATAQAAKTRQEKGIYVYGVLPADVEVTADVPGVGERPGLLRVVRFDGLAALISEVDVPGRLGSADDLRTYREILDATAVEMPILPLRFGTLLASEDAVAKELLAARYDEFTAVLEQLDGRAEFQVKGRYIKDAVLGEALAQTKQAARLRDAMDGEDPGAAQKARLELDLLINEAVTASRKQDMRALRQAMGRLCVASAAREPAHELDAVDIAFLAALSQEREVERAIDGLAREWEGRIDVQLLGPMAAYDFAGTTQPGN